MPTNPFPDDFLWGAATASFQVEGAAREDGRGESIWDRFCRTPGKVHAGDNGDVSCDQYHRYPEDIALMKKLDLKAYRFSIAWPRVVPAGSGEPNPAGIAWYKRLIAALLEAGIEPVPTLYHWDLPQALEEAGGWTNRATAEAFAAYARICFGEFGSSVKKWVTLNEPFCSAYLGYLHGIHAPGKRDETAALRAIHHLNLAHGLAVRSFRETGLEGEIGIVWNLMTPRAATRRSEDLRAAERSIDRDTRMFTGPVLGKGYPAGPLAGKNAALPVRDGDLAIIAQPIDFVGLNYYNERPVSGDADDPSAVSTEPSCERVTDMLWPVVSEGLLRQLRWFRAEAGDIPLYITENGCAERDTPTVQADGTRRIHDPDRMEYLRQHLDVCARAIAEGIALKGYFVWSFIDNFEWNYGYSKRFGIVWCDYATLQRIPKDSFYFYRDTIAGYSRLGSAFD